MNRLKILFIIFSGAFLLFFSCAGKNSNPQTIVQKSIPDTIAPYKKPSSGLKDTLVITGNSAVFFSPDSTQLKKIQGLLSPMRFDSDQHDCFFQMKNAREVLKNYWGQVRVKDTRRERYLLFLNTTGARTCIDLDLQNQMCGIYIFKPGKEPLFVDMTNIDTQLHFYFQE